MPSSAVVTSWLRVGLRDTEDMAVMAMHRLGEVWERLHPAERHRIVDQMLERVDIVPGGLLKVNWREPGSKTLIAEFAPATEAEGMDVTQVRRVLRLTLLAPDLVERLAGSPDAVLEKMMRRPLPNGWGDQMRVPLPPV